LRLQPGGGIIDKATWTGLEHSKSLCGIESLMKLAPGKYFGDQIAQRQAAGVCITLCRYGSNSKLPKHAHENPGFFFLLSGDHREASAAGDRIQPESSLLFHWRDSQHETEIGPRGMVGLNIAFNQSWLEKAQMPALTHRDGWILGKPLAKMGALRILGGINGTDVGDEIIQLLDLLDTCQRRQDSRPPKWLVAVRERLESDYMTHLSFAQIADEIAVHPVYLARAFRTHYGCTATQYLHHIRMIRAIALVTSGMTLGEAAAECGFFDQAHLARITRAKLGVCPSALNWFKTSKAGTGHS
jgi:AraC-like DNA-binding protein